MLHKIVCSSKSRDRRSSRERDRKRSRSRSRERHSKRHRSKSPRQKHDSDKPLSVIVLPLIFVWTDMLNSCHLWVNQLLKPRSQTLGEATSIMLTIRWRWCPKSTLLIVWIKISDCFWYRLRTDLPRLSWKLSKTVVEGCIWWSMSSCLDNWYCTLSPWFICRFLDILSCSASAGRAYWFPILQPY